MSVSQLDGSRPAGIIRAVQAVGSPLRTRVFPHLPSMPRPDCAHRL